MRGAVSLAAALAIPLALPGGAPFPHRDLLVFITFSVILVTLVAGGVTLPAVVRALHIVAGTEERDELRLAMQRSEEAALARIDELESEGRIDPEHAKWLREVSEHRSSLEYADDPADREHHTRHREVERELIAARRRAVIELRERGEIDNVVLRRVQAELDRLATRQNPIADEA